MLHVQKIAALAALAGLFLAGAVAAADNPSATDTAAQKALAKDAVCTTCHNESWRVPVLTLYQTRHGNRADPRAPNCQSCHGESTGHQTDPGGVHPDVVFATKSKNVSSVEQRGGACLTCHDTKILPRTHWVGSEHQSRDVTCTNCHAVHTPKDAVLAKETQASVCFACHKTQRAEIQRISTHPIAVAKVVCTDCHNPHGSNGPKLLVKNSTNETCWTCHAEKRGPFLWEHPSAMDDCMNCHTPHGSTNPPLLRARAPFLCQECHGDGAPHPGNVYSAASLPGGAVANITATGGVSGTTQVHTINPVTGAPITQNNPPPQLAFRACLNCHQNVHGSNHPAGNRFLR
jgi:DmsE family decaheme c-type cytochrome